MNFLHSEVSAGSENVILVTLDSQANVLLLDDSNFSAYRSGRAYQYRGGWANRSPARLVPPYHGQWHVVIDLGGRAGTIRAGVRVI